MLVEPISPVRKAVMGSVAIIARHTVPRDEWPGIIDFLFHFCRPCETNHHREVAMQLFCSLAEDIPGHLTGLPQFPVLRATLVQGLGDRTSLTIRRIAIKATAALLAAVDGDPHLAGLAEVVPALVLSAQECINNTGGVGSQEREEVLGLTTATLEALSDALEFPSAALAELITPTIHFVLQTVMNPQLELTIREAVLGVLYPLAQFKPKLLSKGGLAAELVRNLCILLYEDDDPTTTTAAAAAAAAAAALEEEEEEEDLIPLSSSKGQPVRQSAAQALDALARGLPSKQVVPTVLAFLDSAIQQPEGRVRAAGLTALAWITEGCCEALRKKKTLRTVVAVVLAGLADGDPQVRRESAFCLGQLAEWVQPDIVDHHRTVLPRLFEVLRDGEAKVVERGCYALDTFCEHLGEDILPFVGGLMEALLHLLRTSPLKIQEMVLSAIASVAASAQGSPVFLGYAQQLLPLLLELMQQESPKAVLKARARATECAGLVLQSIGREQCSRLPVAGHIVHAALQGLLTIDDTELREWSYGFFHHLADTIKEDVTPLMSQIVDKALASLDLADEGRAEEREGEEGGEREEEDDDDDDDDDDDAGTRRFSVRTGVMDEKCAATLCLGSLARAAGQHFMKQMADVIPAVVEMTQYFHEDVRRQAYGTCAGLIVAVFRATVAGAVNPAMFDETYSVMMEALMGAASGDDDLVAVACAFEALGEIVKEVGKLQTERFLGPMVRACVNVLGGDSVAQQVARQDYHQDEVDEENDEAEELLGSAADLVGALAEVLGADSFAPIFKTSLYGPIKGLMSPKQPYGVRQVAVGCFAECLAILQEGMAEYVPAVAPVLFRELRCEESQNRRNAAFTVGLLFKHCCTLVAPDVMKYLEHLHPLFDEDEDASTTDNAVGAVCQIMMAGDRHGLLSSLPMQQILETVVKALPLKSDKEEAEVTYAALAHFANFKELGEELRASLIKLGSRAAYNGNT